MRRLTILGIAASAVTLSGCATTDLPSMSEMLRDVTEQDGRACIDEDDIEGYGVLEHNVISIDGEQDYYLATVSSGCDDELEISVDDDSDDDLVDDSDDDFGNDSDEICGESGDELDADEDDCEIHQVFEFDDREEAFEAFNDVMEAREAMGED